MTAIVRGERPEGARWEEWRPVPVISPITLACGPAGLATDIHSISLNGNFNDVRARQRKVVHPDIHSISLNGNPDPRKNE